jgi:ABC-type transport system involved in multi-copper enzyme maturation permease subunit
MRMILILARTTLREASRRRISWIGLGLGLLFLLIYGLGVNALKNNVLTAGRALGGEIGSTLLLMGLYVVYLLSGLSTILVSADTLAGEISSGTIHTLASKPIGRWQILLGKALGLVVLLFAYVLLLGGGVVLLVYLLMGYSPSGLAPAAGLIALNVLVLLSLSLLGGTALSTLANGALTIGLFGVSFVGGLMEQIGALAHDQTVINVGIISGLILPSDTLWRRAAFGMQPPLLSQAGITPFSTVSVPSDAMIIYAGVYFIVLLAFALLRFQHRDL